MDKKNNIEDADISNNTKGRVTLKGKEIVDKKVLPGKKLNGDRDFLSGNDKYMENLMDCEHKSESKKAIYAVNSQEPEIAKEHSSSKEIERVLAKIDNCDVSKASYNIKTNDLHEKIRPIADLNSLINSTASPLVPEENLKPSDDEILEIFHRVFKNPSAVYNYARETYIDDMNKREEKRIFNEKDTSDSSKENFKRYITREKGIRPDGTKGLLLLNNDDYCRISVMFPIGRDKRFQPINVYKTKSIWSEGVKYTAAPYNKSNAQYNALLNKMYNHKNRK